MIARKSKLLHWTHHARVKMRYYGISEARVRRVLNLPKRIEEGIAPKTIAMMQSVYNRRRPYEIWTMIQEDRNRRKVISAWKYPGMTKSGKPLPEEILREIRSAL